MFDQNALTKEMPNLRKFALRLTRNAADADDLVQSTVLRALEKHEQFQEGTSLFSWTSKIMFNLFASQYRHKKKFDTQYDPAPYVDQMSVEATQEASVDLKTVTECMKRLSDDHRQIIVMVCVKGMQYEEVAAHLDIPLGTVRSRLSRARQQLQELLAPQGIDVTLPPAEEIPQIRDGHHASA